MRDDPPTRYPLPEFRLFPREVPWDTPISDLSGWWLSSTCDEHGTVAYPLRLMAANLGWKRTLRSIVPKLKCKSCGGRPIKVELVEYAGMNDKHPGFREGRLVLIGR